MLFELELVYPGELWQVARMIRHVEVGSVALVSLETRKPSCALMYCTSTQRLSTMSYLTFQRTFN
jgi:hypothetical protein